MTILPAPTIAFSPMVTLARIVEPEPTDAPFLTSSSLNHPVAFGLQLAVGGRRSWIDIVYERHAVTDEDIVLNRHAFTDERVAGNFTVSSHGRIFLDLDE